MKKITNLKIGVILSLLFFLTQNLFAQDFIINDDGLIDPRAKTKINEIGNEVKTKLGVNIYVYTKATLGLDENLERKKKFDYIKNYEKELTSALEAPYVLLTMSVEDQYIKLLYSKELEDAIDRDEILDDYVIPLLASKDKNTLFAKVSAAMLNGYSAIVDGLVKNHNTRINSDGKNEIKEVNIVSNDEIGNQGKVSSTIWKVTMYFLIVTGLLAYTYAVLRKKK